MPKKANSIEDLLVRGTPIDTIGDLAAAVSRLKSKQLVLTVSPMERFVAFKIIAEIAQKRFDFYVHIPIFNTYKIGDDFKLTAFSYKVEPQSAGLVDETASPPRLTIALSDEHSPMTITEDSASGEPRYEFILEFSLIQMTLFNHVLSQEEHETLLKAWYPNKRGPRAKKYSPDIDNPYPRMDPKGLDYFGDLLERILEKIGYEVVIAIPDYYFPSPTSTAILTPAFGLSLRKDVTPIDIKKGYEDIFVYLSHEKPKSKVQVQLNILDNIPEERLRNLQRAFKDSLSPYGLKSLYLTIEECNRNKRNHWFTLDINNCLDLMGYKRKKKGSHEDKNRKRLLQELEDLTQINFNVEARTKKKGRKNVEEVLKFNAPLLSITGRFEKYEVKDGEPIEKGRRIQDGVQIFIHPAIYNYINEGWYTILPHEFLKIDTRSKPHAINLYSYIANQWRIGWHKYQGTITQPMKQILEGAGLLNSWPKRKNQQRDFVKKVIDNLRWLKGQKAFWIENVKVEAKNRPPLDPLITITAAGDHPLKVRMRKKMKEGE